MELAAHMLLIFYNGLDGSETPSIPSIPRAAEGSFFLNGYESRPRVLHRIVPRPKFSMPRFSGSERGTLRAASAGSPRERAPQCPGEEAHARHGRVAADVTAGGGETLDRARVEDQQTDPLAALRLPSVSGCAVIGAEIDF